VSRPQFNASMSLSPCKYMLENTEGTIKNGQFGDTGNIGYMF